MIERRIKAAPDLEFSELISESTGRFFMYVLQRHGRALCNKKIMNRVDIRKGKGGRGLVLM